MLFVEHVTCINIFTVQCYVFLANLLERGKFTLIQPSHFYYARVQLFKVGHTEIPTHVTKPKKSSKIQN